MIIATKIRAFRRLGTFLLMGALVLAVKGVLGTTAMTSDTITHVIVAPDKQDELEERAYVEEQTELKNELDNRDLGATINTDVYR